MDIQLELDEHFSCSGCGKCCTTPWRVKVGAVRAEVIRQTSVYARLQREGYVPLPVTDGQAQTARRSDSTCLFLRDGGCDIHRELDGFSKPTVCQLYPFSLVNTPDGYYLSLLFSCPSVAKGGGVPLSDQLPDLRRTLTESEYFDGLTVDGAQVFLADDCTVDWASWKALEPEVLRVLKGGHGVSGAVKVAASILGHLREPGRSWIPSKFHQSDLETVADLFPIYTGFAVALLDGAIDPQEQERVCDLLLSGEPYLSRHLERTLPELHFNGPLDEQAAASVDRFLDNFVKGKRLLQDGSVLSRVLALGVSLAVLNYYHSVVEKLSASSFSHGALAWAFEIVEAGLLGHSDKAMSVFCNYEHQLLKSLQSESIPI